MTWVDHSQSDSEGKRRLRAMSIPYGRQMIDQDDIAAVVEVLRSDWLTQGPSIERFERKLADKVQASFAVAFSHGTAALYAAVGAAGLGPEHKLVTSAISFIASAACGIGAGCRVDLVDVEEETLNLDPRAVPADADALVAVHYAGLPIDLSRLSHRPRVIIEDAAHALGATTPDGPVGNCAHSDMSVFSFHPVKAITTGEGGAVTTNDEQLAQRLRMIRNHGIVPKPQHGAWYYEVESIGSNYRLTDFQAALGMSQLDRLDGFIERRNRLAQRYDEALSGANVSIAPRADPGWRHANHLYPARVERRQDVYRFLHDHDVHVQVHYVPLYRHPVLKLPDGPDRFPKAEAAYERLLSLPLFPGLSFEAQDRVVSLLIEALTSEG